MLLFYALYAALYALYAAALTACARGSAELVEQGAPIAGEDGGVLRGDGGVLRGDAGADASRPKPTGDGGTVKPGDELDAGNPVNPPDAGGTSAGQDPRPVLGDIDPVSVAVNPANDVSLTVLGSAFVPRTVVQTDGLALATTFVSSTELQAVLAKSALTALKTIKISVSTAAPGGGLSAATRDFRVVPSVPVVDTGTPAVNPSPVLSAISPSFVAQGSAAQTLTLAGSGFLAGARVSLAPTAGGAATVLAPATQSPTQLTVSVSASLLAAAAVYDVTVTNPVPSAGPSASRPFTVWSGSCPTANVDVPLASTGVTVDFDLSWAAASTSTGIYGGSSSCGTALNPVVKRKFRPVIVQNNTPSAVVLSAWAKCTGNDAAWLAFYRGTTVPVSDTELRTCNGKIGQGVGIYGAPAADSAGSVSCPGLMRADNAGIRLEACEAVVVYMQMQTSSGAVPTKLRVRAEAP